MSKSIFELDDIFNINSPFKHEVPSVTYDEGENALDYPYRKYSSIDLKLFRPNKGSTFWKLGKGTYSSYRLYDYDGKQIYYCNFNSSLAGTPIILPSGTRVILLGSYIIQNTLLKRVILFWKGKYREGLIRKEAYKDGFFTGLDRNSVELFINDSERILFELSIRQNDYQNYGIITEAVARIKKYFIELRTNKNKRDRLNNNFRFAVKKYYHNNFITNARNRPIDVLQKATDFFSGNKKILQYINSKNIHVLPISIDWIDQNAMKYGQESPIGVFRQKLDSLYITSDFNGYVGIVKVSKPSYIDDEPGVDHLEFVVPILKELTSIVRKNTEMSNSAQGKWLLGNIGRIERLTLTNTKGAVIIMGADAWDMGKWLSYAGYIGIQNSFGPLYSNPLHTVLLHEFDQDESEEHLDYIPLDSHIDKFELKYVMDEISKEIPGYFENNMIFQEPLGDGHYKSDLLYQCNLYLKVLFLDLFLNKYLKR